MLACLALCMSLAACGESDEAGSGNTAEGMKLQHGIAFGMTYDEANEQYQAATGMDMPSLKGNEASGYLQNGIDETLKFYGISKKTRENLHTPEEAFVFNGPGELCQYVLVLKPEPEIVSGVSEELVGEDVLNEVAKQLDALLDTEHTTKETGTYLEMRWETDDVTASVRLSATDSFQVTLTIGTV